MISDLSKLNRQLPQFSSRSEMDTTGETQRHSGQTGKMLEPASQISLSSEVIEGLALSSAERAGEPIEIVPQTYRFRDADGVERADLVAKFDRVPNELKGFVASVLEARHLRFAAEAAYVRGADESDALAQAWASSRMDLANEVSRLGL